MTVITRGTRAYARRAILRGAVGGAATAAVGAVLAACGSSATPVAPTSAATTVAPTAAKPAATTASTSAPAAAATAPASAATTGATAATTGGATAAGSATAASPAASAASAAGGMTAAAVDGKVPSPNPQIGVPDAYLKLPPSFKSVAMTPGNKGSKVSAYVINYDPPIPPRDSNKYWQELEKRLGVTYDVIQSPAATYQEKTTALIAGGDLPDLVFLDTAGAPDLNKAILQGAFADLSSFLTGDALKDYPNLAAFAPVLWKNVSLNKKIYGVPRPRFLANNGFYFRQDWADKVGFSTQKNADDVFNMFVGMSKNHPDGGTGTTFGLSASSPRPQFGIDILKGMFRAPNEWRLNPDGTLTRDYETDEYRQTVDFARRLWAAGGYHPDSTNLSTNQNKDLMAGGKIGAYNDGLAGLMGAGIRGRAKTVNPSALVTGWSPPGFDGGKPVYNKYIGYFGFTAISAKAAKDKERVKELLRIVNYFASPFGSEENIFLSKGIEGVHYTMQNGNPILNDLGKAEIGVNSGVQGVIVGLTNPPPVAFYDPPSDGPDMQKVQSNLLANAIDSAVWGYYSPTNSSKGAELAQLQADALTAVVTGRDPMSAWDTFLKDWRSRGGDQIRKEYQDAIKGA